MTEWVKKKEVMNLLTLPPDILADHIHELPGVFVSEDLEEALNVVQGINITIKAIEKARDEAKKKNTLSSQMEVTTYEYGLGILRSILLTVNSYGKYT